MHKLTNYEKEVFIRLRGWQLDSDDDDRIKHPYWYHLEKFFVTKNLNEVYSFELER